MGGHKKSNAPRSTGRLARKIKYFPYLESRLRVPPNSFKMGHAVSINLDDQLRVDWVWHKITLQPRRVSLFSKNVDFVNQRDFWTRIVHFQIFSNDQIFAIRRRFFDFLRRSRTLIKHISFEIIANPGRSMRRYLLPLRTIESGTEAKKATGHATTSSSSMGYSPIASAFTAALWSVREVWHCHQICWA